MDTDLSPSPAWASDAGVVSLTAPAPPSAEQVADRLAIGERIARYAWSYDERNRAGLEECFAPDGTWEGLIMGREPVGPFAGRAAVADFLAGFWDHQRDQRRHVLTDVVCDVHGRETATAHAYLMLMSASEETSRLETTGAYRFELVREDDGVWRIDHLVAGFDAPF